MMKPMSIDPPEERSPIPRHRPSINHAESFNVMEVSRMKKMQFCLVLVALIVFFHIEKDIVNFGDIQNATTSTKTSTNYKPKHPTNSPVLPPPSLAPIPDKTDGTDSPTIALISETEPPKATQSSNSDSSDSDDSALPNVVASPSTPIPGISPSSPPVSIHESNVTLVLPTLSTEITSQQEEFSEKECDLTSVSSWYPSQDAVSWKLRAPYVIVAGVWNSGSKSLSQRLYKQSQISKEVTKTNGFFLPKNFMKFANPNPKVFAARERMYAQAYNVGMLQSTPKVVAMDVSPGYLFYAKQVSQSILCVSPWAKTIIILRNPIDRVYEQWAQAQQSRGLRIGLEQWIANEIELIQSVGLVGLEPKSAEEQEAWKKYQNVRSMANAIGRSMYALQLEEWIETYKRAGKDPKQEIFIVPSEVLQNEGRAQEEYNKIISFLGLSPEMVDTSTLKPLASSSALPMEKEIRDKLETFFKPYNKRLYKLLEAENFLEYQWKDLWASS